MHLQLWPVVFADHKFLNFFLNILGPNTVDRNRVASAGLRGSKFRHGLLTLMIHSIDPMHDGGKHFVFLFCCIAHHYITLHTK